MLGLGAAEPANLDRYADHFAQAWSWKPTMDDAVAAPEVDKPRTPQPFPMGWKEKIEKTHGPTRFQNELLIFVPPNVAPLT